MKTYKTPATITLLRESYPMQLTGNDAKLIVRIVNMGIDSRLTAVTDSAFEWVTEQITPRLSNTKLHCNVSPSDLMIIIRRLLEVHEQEDNEEAHDLAQGIIYTLGHDANDHSIVPSDFIDADRPYVLYKRSVLANIRLKESKENE